VNQAGVLQNRADLIEDLYTCRAAMIPDVLFGTAYIISMIAYGELTYVAIFRNFA